MMTNVVWKLQSGAHTGNLDVSQHLTQESSVAAKGVTNIDKEAILARLQRLGLYHGP
jgi:hypothetical protein